MSANSLEQHREAAFENVKNAWEYLKFLEKNSIHRPRDVVVLGNQLIRQNLVPSVNRWRLLERIAICSMELGDSGMAKTCIEELLKKFGSESKRARVLTGMFFEAKASEGSGDYKKSMDRYDAVLADDGNHMMAMKRKIAVYLSKREINKGIRELTSYLELYCNDREAWKQLCQLYCKEHQYQLAKFCIEELMLMAGEDYLLHLQYAEMLYNMGGNANLTNALKYFAQSVLFGGDGNVRACWGIVMTIRALRDTGDASGGQENGWLSKLSAHEKELLMKANEKIVECYAKKNSSLVDIVKDSLMIFEPNE